MNDETATPEERRHAIAEILARGYRRLLEGRPPREPPELVKRSKPKAKRRPETIDRVRGDRGLVSEPPVNHGEPTDSPQRHALQFEDRPDSGAIWSFFKKDDRQLNRSPGHREVPGASPFWRRVSGMRERGDHGRDLHLRGGESARSSSPAGSLSPGLLGGDWGESQGPV